MEKYTKLIEKTLSEINVKATILRHNKSGARICLFDTDDNNKVFTIAFKTPAINSTGVTHIIEHSVLCGSKKYPLKDPFVELIKGSLNTFLNAFTFPDKTMYPCASTNTKDFKNLMDIYLDAVFFPKMYTCKNVFLQEGWHYEVFNKDDEIKYNGVVYNEMKGALSNKDEVLSEAVLNNLFPNSTYKYISGGDPEHITDLTYEDFINFHKKYYSPSNSYIFLYGKMDFEERLKYLDEEYLSKFDKIDVNPLIDDGFTSEKFVEKTIYYPVSKDDNNLDVASFAYALTLGSSLNTKEDIAFDILNKILIDSPSAILKGNLLKAGIGSDVSGGNQGGIKNNHFEILVKNAKKNQKEEFLKICNSTFVNLVKNGLDHEAIIAYLNNFEFKVRENQFSSFPLGLTIILKSMDSWLYNDDEPFLKLDILKYIYELKNDVNNGYFEELIKKYLLNNEHSILITQLPSITLQDEREKKVKEKLSNFKKSLSDKELENLIKLNLELRKYQSTPDSKEVIESLPHLTLEDLKEKPENYECSLISNSYNLYYSNYFTNNIIYGEYLFDATKVSYKKVKELKLLTICLSKLKTAKHNNIEIDKFISENFGDFDTSLDIFNMNNSLDYKLLASFQFSIFKEKLSFVNKIVLELINDVVFDEEKIYEIIGSEKAILDGAIDYGHVLALNRSRRNFSKRDYINDEINGIGYIYFINDLLTNFNTKKNDLIKSMKELFAEVFVKDNFSSFATLEKENNDYFKKESDLFFESLPMKKVDVDEVDEFSETEAKKEAFILQSDINFVARSSLLSYANIKYSGHMDVLSNALAIDYMWQNVRVKGGAYGANFVLSKNKGLAIASYRDPHVLETDLVYRNIPNFIRNMNYTDEDMLKLKIGAISNLIMVLHVKRKGKVAFNRLITDLTYDEILKSYNELLATTNDDLVNLAKSVEELINKSNLCVVGNEKDIGNNSALFDIIRKLN